MQGTAEKKDFSRRILDALTAHIAVLDAQGVIVATNAAWREFAEKNGAREADAFRGVNYLSLCDGASGPSSDEAGEVAAAIREILAGGRDSFRCEYPCHSPEVRRWFVVRITRLPGEGPAHLVVSHQDMTSRRLAQEALREMERRREEDRLVMSKLEATGVLAGGIAHDFNNLLGIILGNVGLMEMRSQPGDGNARYLAAIQNAVSKAQALTQRLLTFSKGGEPVMERISLAALLEENSLTALRDSPVTCECSFSPDLREVMADEGQIGQVVQSMMFNAREAMPAGGTVFLGAENAPPGSLEGLSLPAGNYVCLTITDHGSGIAAESLPKIFDPYFSTKKLRNKRGLGLGLAICRSIIQKHGGTITVASTVGAGTTFHLYLPAAGKEETPQEVVAEALALKPSRILVMDDEEMIRNFVQSALTRTGCEVQTAEEGGKAIALYRAAMDRNMPFAAVILDLTIQGGMGGVETLHRLREIDPAVQAVASSGAADDPVIDDFSGFGFAERLIKPYSIDHLRETLSRVLGS